MTLFKKVSNVLPTLNLEIKGTLSKKKLSIEQTEKKLKEAADGPFNNAISNIGTLFSLLIWADSYN